MALTATIYNVDIDLADADRGVYESLALRVARHPSESQEFLITRILAYALEAAPGIAFSPGLSTPDEPAIAVRDMTGVLRAWIEVGTPSAERLHKASKAAPRVAVYVHKDVIQHLKSLGSERIHRADAIEVWGFDRALVSGLVSRMERRMAFSLSVAERELYVSIGADTLTGVVTRHRLA
ncbi:MAG: YaeQ family protein [Vicinamibacterales bacterium]